MVVGGLVAQHVVVQVHYALVHEYIEYLADPVLVESAVSTVRRSAMDRVTAVAGDHRPGRCRAKCPAARAMFVVVEWLTV